MISYHCFANLLVVSAPVTRAICSSSSLHSRFDTCIAKKPQSQQMDQYELIPGAYTVNPVSQKQYARVLPAAPVAAYKGLVVCMITSAPHQRYASPKASLFILYDHAFQL